MLGYVTLRLKSLRSQNTMKNEFFPVKPLDYFQQRPELRSNALRVSLNAQLVFCFFSWVLGWGRLGKPGRLFFFLLPVQTYPLGRLPNHSF